MPAHLAGAISNRTCETAHNACSRASRPQVLGCRYRHCRARRSVPAGAQGADGNTFQGGVCEIHSCVRSWPPFPSHVRLNTGLLQHAVDIRLSFKHYLWLVAWQVVYALSTHACMSAHVAFAPLAPCCIDAGGREGPPRPDQDADVPHAVLAGRPRGAGVVLDGCGQRHAAGAQGHKGMCRAPRF